MKLCAIAFSTEWFLTIPGILVSCGVLLLIIALIMFIVSATKGKKKEEVPASLEQVVEPVQSDSVVVPQEEVTPVVQEEIAQEVVTEPVEEVVAVNEPMGPITEVVMPDTVVPEVPVIEVGPVVEEIQPEEVVVEPVIPVIEPILEPIIEPVVTEVEPDVIPTEVISAPEFVEPVLENADIMTDNLEKTNINIYGGVAPVVPPVEEEVRSIYGGADPLDATQNLPKMDVHHEPYSGGKEVVEEASEVVEIPVVEPVQEEVIVPEIVKIPDNADVEQL